MWSNDQLQHFAQLDDFYVAPFHPDMKTTGTLTYIWSVVADHQLYIRGGYGQHSKWYAAARQQKAGQIKLGGHLYDVKFELIPETGHEALMTAIDHAYIDKYTAKSARSTKHMPEKSVDGPRTATVRVLPR